MAQVSLKSYENEIRNFIENRQFDEAMSTGQHILQYYPKHVQTYGLLGEVCLATGRYEEAADTLLRVLSVDPENVAARLGLSAAHEATRDLPGAIEQMRIAFDLAPSTRAMHDQMHRLLKLHKGEPVPKLKLTRQGLGRIYMRGELYTQAADEFEALLRENPDQVDVEVSLAEALWKDGQRIRSIEVCQSVLNKLPYCLKAHLILAETWLCSDREDEAQAHLRIVREIDPDGEVSYNLLGDESPLPRTEVLIPSIEDSALAQKQAEATVPGPVTPQTAQAGEALSSPAGSDAGEAEVSGIDITEIPDWLRQAKPEEVADEPIADADLPVWLTAGVVAADLVDREESSETVKTAEHETGTEAAAIPVWLSAATPGEAGQQPDIEEITELEDFAEMDETAGEAMPPWLQGMPEAPVSAEETSTVSPAEELIAGDNALPPWLDELDAQETSEIEATLPQTSEEAAPSEVEAASPTGAESAAEAAESAAEQAQVPAWAQNLLLEEDLDEARAAEPELDATEANELPAWVRDLEPPESTVPVAGIQPDTVEENAIPELAAAEDETAEQAEQEPSWLRILREEGATDELASEQELAELEAATVVAEGADDLPAWLHDIKSPERTDPVTETQPDIVAESASVEPVIAEEEALTAQEQEPTWLRILREEGATDELPSEGEFTGLESAEGITEEEVEAGIPAWLRDLHAQEGLTSSELDAELADAVAQEQLELPSEESLSESGLIDELTADAHLAEETLSALASDAQAVAEETQGSLRVESAVRPPFLDERKADLPTEEQLEEVGLVEELEPEPEIATEDQDADLPEWLRKAAFAEGLIDDLAEGARSQPAESSAPADSTVTKQAGLPVAEETAEEESVQIEETEDVPDWLKLFQQNGPSHYVMPVESEAGAEDLEPSEVPASTEETLEIPEWLQLLRQGEEEQQAGAPDEGEPTAELGAEETERLPEEQPSDSGKPPEETTALSGFFPGNTTDQATIRSYEDAVKENPKDYTTRWELVQAYVHAGNHEAAVEHSQYLVESGEFVPEILEYLEKLSATGVKTRNVYQIIGDGYFKLDRFQEATTAYRNALSMLG